MKLLRVTVKSISSMVVFTLAACLLVSCAKPYYEFHTDYERQVNEALQRPNLVVDQVIDRRAKKDLGFIGALQPGLVGSEKDVKLDRPVDEFVGESLKAMLTNGTAQSGSIPLTVYIDSFHVKEGFSGVLKRVEFATQLTFVFDGPDGTRQEIPTSSLRFKEWAAIAPEEAEQMMYYSLRECVDQFLLSYDTIFTEGPSNSN